MVILSNVSGDQPWFSRNKGYVSCLPLLPSVVEYSPVDLYKDILLSNGLPYKYDMRQSSDQPASWDHQFPAHYLAEREFKTQSLSVPIHWNGQVE